MQRALSRQAVLFVVACQDTGAVGTSKLSAFRAVLRGNHILRLRELAGGHAGHNFRHDLLPCIDGRMAGVRNRFRRVVTDIDTGDIVRGQTHPPQEFVVVVTSGLTGDGGARNLSRATGTLRARNNLLQQFIHDDGSLFTDDTFRRGLIVQDNSTGAVHHLCVGPRGVVQAAVAKNLESCRHLIYGDAVRHGSKAQRSQRVVAGHRTVFQGGCCNQCGDVQPIL